MVGKKRPQFSLFGDTINTAARMQSKAPPNRIQISPSTMELVTETRPPGSATPPQTPRGEPDPDSDLPSEFLPGYLFELKPNKIVAKGKGEMHCALICNVEKIKLDLFSMNRDRRHNLLGRTNTVKTVAPPAFGGIDWLLRFTLRNQMPEMEDEFDDLWCVRLLP